MRFLKWPRSRTNPFVFLGSNPAYGINLTSASRVYFMDAIKDAGKELQVRPLALAGRVATDNL